MQVCFPLTTAVSWPSFVPHTRPPSHSLLLASRGIVEGIKHVDKLFDEEDDSAVIKKRVRADDPQPFRVDGPPVVHVASPSSDASPLRTG